MLQLTDLFKFAIYCIFVIFTVNYITHDKISQNSRYILIVLLILPYLFMDQFTNYTNVSNNTENFAPIGNTSIENAPIGNAPIGNRFNIKQPSINLNEIVPIENNNALEEIKIKKEIETKKEIEIKKEIETKKLLNKETFTVDEVQKLLNLVKSNKVVEHLDATTTDYVYNLNPKNNLNNITNADYEKNLQPLGQNGEGFTNEWDQDYILLNTTKWAPSLRPPPVCKQEKECPVCPSITSGYPLNLKEFNSSRKITPPVNADLVQMNM